MKNKMNIARKLIVFATLFLISCSEDLYENGNSHNNEDIKISKVSLKESRFQNKPKLIQEVNKVKSKQNSTSTTGRMVYDSINNFYFDDENGMLVETSSGYESYTFKVEREVPTNYELENIVFSKNGNEYDVTIVKYELTTSEIEQLEDNILFEPTVEPEIEVISRVMDCNTKIDKCTIIISPSSGEIIGYEITYLDPCEGSSGGSNTGSGSGTGTGDSGSGTGSGTGGLDPIGSGTGTSWEGGGSNTNGGLITTPTGGRGSSSLNMENFILSLQFNQQEWLDNQSSQTQQSIFNYLNSNGFTTTSKNLIKNLINYILQNPNISWDEIYESFFSPYPETGNFIDINPDEITYETPLIPQPLPSLTSFTNNFPKIGTSGNFTQMPASDVYNLVRGTLLNSYNNSPNAYSNACSIRGSRGLLYSNIQIPVLNYNGSQRTQKGGDLKNYILDAKSFNKFMIDKFGETSNKLEGTAANNPQQVLDFLSGKNGIYVIINNNPSLAGYTGHVDLIINGNCIGNEYLQPTGGIKSIRIWSLN